MEWTKLANGLITTVAYTCVGLIVFALAFWIMELVAPFSIKKEIETDHNNALAIIMGSIIIGISLIIFGAVIG